MTYPLTTAACTIFRSLKFDKIKMFKINYSSRSTKNNYAK